MRPGVVACCLIAVVQSTSAADLPLLKIDPGSGRIYSDTDPDIRLFGVNYLGGMYQYATLGRARNRRNGASPPPRRTLFQDIGLAPERVKSQIVDRDLDDLEQMGVNLVRIHVLMGDIALRGGGLREGSQELDWFDYLIAGAIRRGMYVYLTPITPWEIAATLPGRFSDEAWMNVDFTSNPGVIARCGAFIRNLLHHINPYLDEGQGRAYGAEPGIAMLGLMNEPEYLTDPSGRYEDGVFSYEFLKSALIDRLIGAVRAGEAIRGGVRHLVGWNMTHWEKTQSAPAADGSSTTGGPNPNIAAAVRDSNVQFLALSGYTQVWWKAYPYFDDPRAEPFLKLDGVAERPALALDRPAARRANVIYEWDAPGSQKNYIYPNIAARMRAGGAQIAALFQYDMAAEAHQNAVWPRHYLNWLYTPEKVVAFMIAGRVFQDRAPSQPYRDAVLNRLSRSATTSFADDLSLYFDGRALLHSRSIPQSLLPAITEALQDVTGVGNSPVAQFDGTGLYRLARVDDGHIELSLNPDVISHARVYAVGGRLERSSVPFDPTGYAWDGPSKLEATRTLASRTHRFVLRWPGLSRFEVCRVLASGEQQFLGEFRAGEPFDVLAGTSTGQRSADARATHYSIRNASIGHRAP